MPAGRGQRPAVIGLYLDRSEDAELHGGTVASRSDFGDGFVNVPGVASESFVTSSAAG